MADEEIIHTDETEDPVEQAPEPAAEWRQRPKKPPAARRRCRRARTGTSSTPTRASSKRWRIPCEAALRRSALTDQIGETADPDRRSSRTARRQEGHQQALALSRIRDGADGNERSTVARGEEHAARHRVRRRRQQPGAVDGRRSEFDFVPAADVRRAPASEDELREERNGAHQRRAVRELLGQSGRNQSGAQHIARAGDDFRPRHAGGTGFPASRKDYKKRRYGKESYRVQ